MIYSWLRGRRWRAHVFATVFELSLLASGVLAAAAAYAMSEPAARDYTLTSRARAKTQHALDLAIREAAPHDPPRLRDFLISAIDAGEFELARGVMLSHGDARESDAQRLHRFLRALPAASQEALALAEQEAAAPALPRQTALVITPAGQSGVYAYAADTLQTLAARAELWRVGQPVDDFGLMLTGLDLALAREQNGLHLLRVARRAGRLDRGYEAYWRAQLARALPPAGLRQALTRALAAKADPLIPIEVPAAFRQALDPVAARVMLADLATLSAIQSGAGASGALVLIPYVHTPLDAERVRLATTAGGDRAAALALLAGRAALLHTAQGELVMTAHLRGILRMLWAILALMVAGGIGRIACELTLISRAQRPENSLSN